MWSCKECPATQCVEECDLLRHILQAHPIQQGSREYQLFQHFTQPGLLPQHVQDLVQMTAVPDPLAAHRVYLCAGNYSRILEDPLLRALTTAADMIAGVAAGVAADIDADHTCALCGCNWAVQTLYESLGLLQFDCVGCEEANENFCDCIETRLFDVLSDAIDDLGAASYAPEGPLRDFANEHPEYAETAMVCALMCLPLSLCAPPLHWDRYARHLSSDPGVPGHVVPHPPPLYSPLCAPNPPMAANLPGDFYGLPIR